MLTFPSSIPASIVDIGNLNASRPVSPIVRDYAFVEPPHENNYTESFRTRASAYVASPVEHVQRRPVSPPYVIEIWFAYIRRDCRYLRLCLSQTNRYQATPQRWPALPLPIRPSLLISYGDQLKRLMTLVTIRQRQGGHPVPCYALVSVSISCNLATKQHMELRVGAVLGFLILTIVNGACVLAMICAVEVGLNLRLMW